MNESRNIAFIFEDRGLKDFIHKLDSENEIIFVAGSDKININTALDEELVQLKGIGKKKAARIIEFREANGPFKRPEDLIKVPGIGPKTFENNKHRISVE